LVLAALGLGAALAASGAEAAADPGALSGLADLPLEDLAHIQVATVSGASGFQQDVTQAPASVWIITGDEIKKLGYRTLAEILGSAPGIYASDDLNYSYLGVRGFSRPGDYNSRVLLLIDGHRLNDNLYNQALIGTEGVLDVDLIERVEVILGPSSSLYGNNAEFGVISITTRRGGAINGTEASVSGGGNNSYQGRLSFGRQFTNGVELALSGSWYDSGGAGTVHFPAFDTPGNNHGNADHWDADQSQSAYGSLRWRELTLTTAFSNREKEVPTASFGTVFNARQEKTTDLRAYADLRLEHDLTPDTHLLARTYYDVYSYDGIYPYSATNTTLPGSPVYRALNADEGFGQWAGAEARITQKLFDRYTLVGGVEYNGDIEQLQHTYYLEPGFPDVRINDTGYNLGLYAEAEAVLLTNLTLNLGVRYDRFNTFGGRVDPRVGLLYTPWKQTHFKLLYGQAFRAPTVFELYYADPGANKANPKLAPETMDSYELVYEQYLPAHLRFSASGYYYRVRDLITQQTDGSGESYYSNLGEVASEGMELQLEHRSPAGLIARASYCLQRSEDDDTGAELSNSPRNLAKLSLIVPVYRDKIFAGAELQYTDSVLTLADNRADSFAVVNLTLFSRELARGLEASASIYNLFDTHYGFPGSADHLQDLLPAPGRDFRVKLTYRF